VVGEDLAEGRVSGHDGDIGAQRGGEGQGEAPLEFLGFCYAICYATLFAVHGPYVLVREAVRLRAQSPV